MTDTTDIRRQFLNSLKRGTGEAYFIVKNNPKIDFSNQIIKGALYIFAMTGNVKEIGCNIFLTLFLFQNNALQ
ncbi:hypothetical protein A8C56_06670 [Niabella ginsenosidivorans]|uniref:Uncharacterized protein n=1 Tax=Niabella ginsenosidivorans TaxID=1176587 RepID=A0A1A9I1W8_9BACT|nr:hypothetical protein A8C56_06670 [Niabella ginsenosidivorans]